MNNEEKILAMLEQLQQGQSALDAGQAQTNARLDKVDSRLDNIASRLGAMDATIADLKEGQEVIRTSQLKVELEQYPRIAAALEGFAVSTKKNTEQDRRISALENSSENHDTRIWALEQVVKAK